MEHPKVFSEEMLDALESAAKAVLEQFAQMDPAPEKGTPVHLSLYRTLGRSEPLLTKIMRLDTKEWQALGYNENDRVSVTRYLGSLGCRATEALSKAAFYQQPLTLELARALVDIGACNKETLSRVAQHQQPLPLELTKLFIDAGVFDKNALWHAARFQHPLTLELAKLLIDAGAFDKSVLSIAAQWQHPLSLELTKSLIDTGAFGKNALSKAAAWQYPLSSDLVGLLIDAGAFDKDDVLLQAAYYQQPLSLELAKTLIDAGCEPSAQNGSGWDSLVCLAVGGNPVDPQVTDLFLFAGCQTNLDRCSDISDEHRLRFDQILKEHAQWKAEKLDQECSSTETPGYMDWRW